MYPRSARPKVALSSREGTLRRSLLRIIGTVAVTLILLGGVWVPSVSVAQIPRRPNLVLVLTDDQWPDSLRAMPLVKSLLADHGVTFANMFASTPLCCPARAGILTGRNSHHTGVVDNRPPNGARAFNASSTLATWLHDSGYATALFGKYLNGHSSISTTAIPPGWDEWWAMEPEAYSDYNANDNGVVRSYGSSPADYSTRQISDRAVSFIARQTGPFFLYATPYAPHYPALPLPRDVGGFTSEPPWRPPSFNEADVSDKPWGDAVRVQPRSVVHDFDLKHRSGLRALQAVDRMVGRIHDALVSTGQLDNTVFVFASDNGFLFGEHRLYGKRWAYEPSVRVPMVIRPPVDVGARVETKLVTNLDITATLLDYAGVAPGLPPDGLSLRGFLEGTTTVWRPDILLEYLSPIRPILVPPWSAVRTWRWKYIEYQNGWRELYDLHADPNELNNLHGQAPYAGTELWLRLRLQTLRI